MTRTADDVLREQNWQCPLCGEPHMPAMAHDSLTLRLYEGIEASLQDMGLGTDERVERARLRLARLIWKEADHE